MIILHNNNNNNNSTYFGVDKHKIRKFMQKKWKKNIILQHGILKRTNGKIHHETVLVLIKVLEVWLIRYNHISLFHSVQPETYLVDSILLNKVEEAIYIVRCVVLWLRL